MQNNAIQHGISPCDIEGQLQTSVVEPKLSLALNFILQTKAKVLLTA